MAENNGTAGAMTATAGPSRRRVHAVPKTMTFEVEVLRDGEPTFVEMLGFYRERCPVWVNIEVDAARDAYVADAFPETIVTDPETGEEVLRPTYRYSRAVEARYRRDVLVAVVRGLQEEDADTLLGTDDGMLMLADLGWFVTRAAEDAAEGPADPEEVAETAPTGGGSSRARRRSTAVSTS